MRVVEASADFAAALASARREAKAGFGDDTVLLEKYLYPTAPHRDAGLRRHAGSLRASVRARLFVAATPPEGRRGSAGPGDDARTRAKRWAPRRSPRRKAIGYVGAGTVEFIVESRGHVLLHGNEHAAAGRAPGHRDDHRARSGRVAIARRRRRAAAFAAGRGGDSRPRVRGAHLRRGPGARIPAVDRTPRTPACSGGIGGGPRRYRRARGRSRSARTTTR